MRCMCSRGLADTHTDAEHRRSEGKLQLHTRNKNKWSRRSQRSSTSAEFNRSALTDHAVQENHVINWADASVIDRESDRSVRWIKEAIHICKEEQQAMNREEGSYQLSHVYDCFLGTFATYCAKNQKKNWYFTLLMKRYIYFFGRSDEFLLARISDAFRFLF